MFWEFLVLIMVSDKLSFQHYAHNIIKKDMFIWGLSKSPPIAK